MGGLHGLATQRLFVGGWSEGPKLSVYVARWDDDTT